MHKYIHRYPECLLCSNISRAYVLVCLVSWFVLLTYLLQNILHRKLWLLFRGVFRTYFNICDGVFSVKKLTTWEKISIIDIHLIYKYVSGIIKLNPFFNLHLFYCYWNQFKNLYFEIDLKEAASDVNSSKLILQLAILVFQNSHIHSFKLCFSVLIIFCFIHL